MASRLVAAFVAVALAAIAVLAGLTLLAAADEVDALVERQQDATTAAVVDELEAAYAAGGSSWERADLRAARVLAAAANAGLVVEDASGQPVAGAPGPGRGGGAGRGGALVPDGALGPARETPVVVDGRAVGVAIIRFPAAQPPPERQVRSALGRTVLWGSLLAVAVAALIGLGATAWIRRPLRRLTATARAMAGGDRSARTGLAPRPGELGELARAFDRMAERIQREDELRRALVADVAHELRTPLAIAQGELEALLDGVEEPTPDRLGSLHEELLRLGRLVEDLGTLSAAEAAGLRLERVRVDLAEVVRQAVEATGSLARAAGVTVALSADAAPVSGDPVRLEQVARNLLANAVKFTPEGGRVDVRVTRTGDACELQVADTGPGIPGDELARVFDRFWRGRHAAGVAGTGIGLAVVAELVSAHGGRVRAENRPGGGAAFLVELPLA